MDPLAVIKKFYPPDTSLYRTLVDHSRQVADKSLEIARGLTGDHPDLDLPFIETAAMLHDIGIFLTQARSIGCTGDKPYICHGYLGRELLDSLGLDKRLGRVCERHTGAGITRDNIVTNRLPLPPRDMVPQSMEEKIICVADKFFSKSPNKKAPLDLDGVIRELTAIDPGHGRRFLTWARELKVLV